MLIGGGAAAYWVLVQSQPVLGTLPVGANLIPQDALMTLSLSTNPSQWQQLREFGTPQTQAMFDRTLTELRDRFLTSKGYNYQRDIQPWAGKEVTFAFLVPQPIPPIANPVRDSATPTQPQSSAQQAVMMVLPIDNPLQAKQILEQPNRSANREQWVERTYKGIPIQETKTNPSQTYSVTVLDRHFLVVTTSPKATERAIDTYQGGKSLATTPGYSQALGKIESDRAFGKLYVNIPVAAAVAKNAEKSLTPDGFAQLQQQQGLATTIVLESEGIGFKGISWLKPNSQKKYAVKNHGGDMAKRLPANALMMISGGNLKQFWQDYVQGAEANPITPLKPEDLRAGIKSATGLSLEQDLLSWMGGEFALSLLPVTRNEAANLSVGLVFMVKVSDRAAAEKTFQRLDDTVGSKYRFQLEQTKVDNQPVVKWKSSLGDAIVSHGWLNGNIAFLTVGASPILNTILPKPQSTLAASAQFRKALPSQPNPNNGNFFIDVERTINANLFPQLPLPPGIAQFSQGIQTIGVTSAVSDERSTRFDIFVNLKKGEKPELLPQPKS